MIGTLAYDLLIVLAAGLIAGVVCRWLRVSVIVGFLVAGVLIGKGGFHWVGDEQFEIEYIAEAGVFLLLFSIGLEFSLDDLVQLGRKWVIAGGTQMVLVALPVTGFLYAIGLDLKPSILIAAATSFSSTVLVFKALSEWGQSSTPHGRRAIGILLFQDAALIPLLLLVPLLTGNGHAGGSLQYLRLLVTSGLFVVAVLMLRRLLAKWIIPQFAAFRSVDLLVLFTLVSIGVVAQAAYSIGLPPAVGAFAAGLIFNGNRWTPQVDALVLPFRETFAAVFFVSLGLLFDPTLLQGELLYLALCLPVLIVIKALAATFALFLTGLRWSTSAGMGIGLAHVGEFAFVLALLGLESGVITALDYQRIVALAIGSLILAPLMVRLGLRWTSAAGSEFVLPKPTLDHAPEHAVVVGAGPIGRQMASRLETSGKDVCLIDLSPLNLHPFAQQGFHTIMGDATENEILSLARVDEASIIVVCVPDDDAASDIIHNLRRQNSKCLVLVRCRYQVHVPALKKIGADHVVSEEAQAGSALIAILDALN